MSAFYDLASLVLVPSGYKASKVYAQKPLTTDGQLTFSRASTATRVNSAGLIETVSSNVPRLDYLGSTCPKLLLEPSRTNVFPKNTEFDDAAWTKRSGMIVTANYGISPDGTQNADRIQFGTSSDGYIYQVRTISPSTAYTISTYAKGTGTIQFNIYDGTGAFTSSIFTLTSEWQRFSFSITTNSTTGVGDMGFFISDDAQVWGAQLEAGAYATSLILTTTAAVTRLADACSKTGITSLIGQTEGTIYIDVDNNETETSCIISTNAGAGTGSHIYIGQNGSNLALYIRNAGTYSIVAGSIANIIGRKKIAVAYGASFARIYMNGTQVFNSTAAVIPSGLDRIEINAFNINTDIGNKKCREVLYFKSKLTDSQLAELTAL